MRKEDVIEILERFVLGAKPCSQGEIVDACASAYRMLKEQPSLPSNLDEAAEESARSWRKNPNGSESRELFFQPHIRGFKAGAEWMAGQGETVEGEIVCAVAHPHENKVIARVYGDYKFGDKVVVQIRKKQ